MPLIDRRTDSVVLRIVYDGPPEAGKTTNLRQLCERLSLGRRGTLENPGGTERTQFFDWLDVTGGYVAGRRLRCQLVTVPGQTELARRRRYLLDSADVVVFVADARGEAMAETRQALGSLRRALAARGGLPLLVQANKQDVAGALDVEALGAALALDAGVPVVAATACSGVGVLETFMLGVRLAVDQIRPVLARGHLDEGEAGGWAELLAAIRAVDGGDDAAAALESVATAAAELVLAAEPVVAPAPAPVVEAAPEPEPTPIVEAAPEPARTALAAAIPRSDVAAGLVWPPQSGRFALRTLDHVRAQGTPVTQHGPHALRCGEWRLYASPEAWLELADARRHLLAAISRQPALGALVPASRTLAIGAGPDGQHRVWYLVEAPRTLADAIAEAGADDGDAVDRRIVGALELIDRLCAVAGRAGLALVIDAAHVSDDGEQYVGPAWPGEAPAGDDARHRLTADLATRRGPPPCAPAPEPAPPPAPALALADDVTEETTDDGPVAADDDLVAIDDVLSAVLAAPAPPCTIEPLAWELPSVDLPAGMVWPQVKGRATLASLTTPGVRTTAEARPWAPAGALEIDGGHGWIAHTCEGWRFTDLDEGRRELLEAVRWHTRLRDLSPEGRTLALSPLEDGARLWMISPDLPSCWRRIDAAVRAGGARELDDAIAIALAALDEIRAALRALGTELDVDLDVIAADARPRLLLPPPGRVAPGARARLAAQLDGITRLTGKVPA